MAQSTAWVNAVSPTTSTLYSVAFSNQNICVAVGDSGTIVRSIDGGTGWSTVNSPVGDALRGVSFFGNNGLAVGISGRILRTTNAGATWKLLARQTTKNLYSVSMSSRMAVATGEEGTILVSTDNGITWTAKTAGSASIFFGVSVYGDSAIGVGGQGAFINTINRGDGWGLEAVGGSLDFFYGATLPDGVVGYAVGVSTSGNWILRTDNTGFTWAAQTSGSTSPLSGVSFSSRDTGTVVGANGTILHTSNGGKQWDSQVSGTTQSLNGVAFLDSVHGIAVGDNGTILRTVTSGNKPTVITKTATKVTDNSATLNGIVNAHGLTTRVWFQYGTVSGSYNTKSSKKTVNGSLNKNINVNIDGLSSQMNYYYRIAARNKAAPPMEKKSHLLPNRDGVCLVCFCI